MVFNPLKLVVRHTILLFLTTFATATAQELTTKSSLELYLNKSAGFKAMMLPNPKYEVAEQGDGPDDVQHQFASGTSSGAYIVAYQDYPNLNSDDLQVTEAVLDVARDGFRKGLGGEQISDRKITLSKRVGREMHFRIPARNAEARSRMFFVNHRWYHVFVLGTPDFVNSDDAKQFMNSFRILEPATAK